MTGATGILRPAVDELLARGDRVLALARGAAALPASPRLVPVVADLTDADSVQEALTAQARPAAAVIYAPSAPAAVIALLAAATTGSVVELLTSRWADPDTGTESPADLPSAGIALLLGWTDDAHGQPRWHTPAEVSRAAVTTLDSGRAAVLGRVRPWSERPD